MGKNDFLSPKAIANRIKSKGLQKLRWYCEMCQKQCRDENGFKCHQTSESHLRQMQVFGLNPTRIIDGYTEEFERNFLQLLALSHRNTRVAAQVVYNEYIADKTHIHMNATKWTTLTEFVLHLGKTGKCKVEDSPKGWILLYKPVDQEEALRDALDAKRKRAEESEEARLDRMIEEQRQRAAKMQKLDDDEEADLPKDLVRDGDAPITINLGITKKEDPGAAAAARIKAAAPAKEEADPRQEEARRKLREEQAKKEASKGKPEYVRLMEEEMARRKAEEARQAESSARAAAAAPGPASGSGASSSPPWLEKGLVVKVMSAKLKGEGYYKQKGLVVKVIDEFMGELSMLGEFEGDIVRVDQAELETVLPAVGGEVRILRVAPQRECRGLHARLLELDIDRYKAKVEVTSGGAERGRVLSLDYEHVCKVQR